MHITRSSSFLEIAKDAVTIATGDLRKFKPEFFWEWKDFDIMRVSSKVTTIDTVMVEICVVCNFDLCSPLGIYASLMSHFIQLDGWHCGICPLRRQYCGQL